MKNVFIAMAVLIAAAPAMAVSIDRPAKSKAMHPSMIREAKHRVTLEPATYVIINSTPQGEMLKDIVWSSNGCAPNGQGGISWTQVSGFVPQVVVNGNKMYIYAPITQLSDIGAAWIEGNISSDGKTVRFPTPQAYMLNGFDVLYATRCNSDGQPDPSNLDLVFSYEDGNLIQEDGGVLLLTNLQGGFYGYGESDIVITKITETPVEFPAGLTPESYMLEFVKNDINNRQTALIAFDGDDVYFSDPLGVADSWFKGLKEGDKITVPTPQYVGSGVGFPMYVTTGKEVRRTEMDPITGQPYEVVDYTVTPNADIVFSYDAATGVIKTDQLLLMNSGKDSRGSAYSAVMAPTYTPWTATAAVPLAPSVNYYFDLNDYAEYGLKGCMISFIVPSESLEGEFIAQENLYYQISFDGQPLEFYDTTMIPYYGQFTDNDTQTSIMLTSGNYDEHTLQVPYNPKRTVALQSFYEFGGQMIPSEKVEYQLVNGDLVDSGVDTVEALADPIEVYYFDLNGLRINPVKGSGIVIRNTVYSDGTTKCEKVIF